MDFGYPARVAIRILLLSSILQIPMGSLPSAYASGAETGRKLISPQDEQIFDGFREHSSKAAGEWEGRPYNEDVINLTYTFIPLVMRNSSSPQNVHITDIFFDGLVHQSESDEYAEVTNQGSGWVNLNGWRLNAGSPSQDFVFPNYVMDPGTSCRVYTNELHPESCEFSFASGVALWQNGGDCGYLYNQVGDLVSTYCY